MFDYYTYTNDEKVYKNSKVEGFFLYVYDYWFFIYFKKSRCYNYL